MALIRRSPSNRARTPGTTNPIPSPVTTGNALIANPYLGGKTPKEQSALAKQTAYLQPKAADLAKGQFGAVTGGVTGSITLEQYKSQRTSLSAATAIGSQLGIKTAAVGPAPGGKGSVTDETFQAFQKDIQLEEMFGMLGSGSAANIRLAAAQTGASIPSLIALENKTLGIRQVGAGKAAFQYSGQVFDVEGNLFVEPTKTSSVTGFANLSQEATAVAAALKPSGGDTNLTSFNNITIGQNLTKATLNVPIAAQSSFTESNAKIANTVTSIKNPGVIQTQVVSPGADAGAQYQKDFVKATGVDIFKPLIAPTTVRAITDITGISQGKAPTLRYADFLGKLTAPGELKGGKLEGVRYADLYEPVSAGSSTLKLTSAGTAFRNLQIKGTPGINIRINR